jgi:hypothetical protein
MMEKREEVKAQFARGVVDQAPHRGEIAARAHPRLELADQALAGQTRSNPVGRCATGDTEINFARKMFKII